MTCNFDPDAWYEREWTQLEQKLHAGELDRCRWEEAVKALEHRLEAMWRLLWTAPTASP